VIIDIFFVFSRRPLADKTIDIGNVRSFPARSVKQLTLNAVFYFPRSSDPSVNAPPIRRITPVRVFVVNDPTEGILVLFARDPQSGCRLVHELKDPIDPAFRRRARELGAVFEDPCHGDLFSYTGVRLDGPAQRGMDQFGVRRGPTGEVIVQLTDFQLGPGSPRSS